MIQHMCSVIIHMTEWLGFISIKKCSMTIVNLTKCLIMMPFYTET